MKDNTLAKLGGTCSIFVGVSYVLIGITQVQLPPDQLCGCSPEKFLPSFAQNPTLLLVQYWAFALGALLAIAAVLAISDTVRSANEGWVRWTSNLAIIGFAVTAIDFFRQMALIPLSAAAYVQGDATIKAALTVPSAIAPLDFNGWLGFGAVGLWVLVVSLLALRGGTWPKILAYVGIAVSIAYFLVVVSNVLNLATLLDIVAGVGGVILAPIWFIWMGLNLRRANS